MQLLSVGLPQYNGTQRHIAVCGRFETKRDGHGLVLDELGLKLIFEALFDPNDFCTSS